MDANSPDTVALAVSIGTGKPDKVRPVAKRGAGLVGRFRAIIKYSAAITTDSERTHLTMQGIAQRTGLLYERFNVDGGLGNINLGEWKVDGERNLTLDTIREQTEEYLAQPNVREQLRRVAEQLVKTRQERSKTERWDIVATGIRYRCPVDRCTSPLLTREEDLKIHLAERHAALGYSWPATSDEGRRKITNAMRDGKVLHAD
jgi:hypothetical protein